MLLFDTLINILDSEVKSDTVTWSDLLHGLDVNLSYSLRNKMLLFCSSSGLKLSIKLCELLMLFIFLYGVLFTVET